MAVGTEGRRPGQDGRRAQALDRRRHGRDKWCQKPKSKPPGCRDLRARSGMGERAQPESGDAGKGGHGVKSWDS